MFRSPVQVIINEQHKLLPNQEKILNERFEVGWELLKIPASGLTKNEQFNLVDNLCSSIIDAVVFVSPVPIVLGNLCTMTAIIEDVDIDVYVFNNDKRVKVEKNGRVFYKIQEDGWELVRVN